MQLATKTLKCGQFKKRRQLTNRDRGRPDHCQTGQLANKSDFFQEFLLKNHLLRSYYFAYYLGFD